VVCTDVLSRGIDVKTVRAVVNYDFPPSTTSYIHRVGRTGRGGRTGRAVTFFSEEDKDALRGVAHIIHNAGGVGVEPWMLTLPKLTKRRRKQIERCPPVRKPITTDPNEIREVYAKRRRKASERAESTARYRSKLLEGSPMIAPSPGKSKPSPFAL